MNENPLGHLAKDAIRDQIRSIHKLSQILTTEGIQHWIDFGTLLGAVREGGFLATDVDVDFNFFAKDRKRLLELKATILQNTNLLLIDGPVIRACPSHSSLDLDNDVAAIQSCTRAGLIYLDLCPCEVSGKFVIHALEAFSFRTFFIDGLESTSFEGFTFPAPRHAQTLLMHRYGRNWRKPLPLRQHREIEYKCVIPFYRQIIAYCAASFDGARDPGWEVLARARELFDVVVVGVYSDETLQQWGKGFTRSFLEREEELRRSGRAERIISNPAPMLERSFLNAHSIDFVVAGQNLAAFFVGIDETIMQENLHIVSSK